MSVPSPAFTPLLIAFANSNDAVEEFTATVRSLWSLDEAEFITYVLGAPRNIRRLQKDLNDDLRRFLSGDERELNTLCRRIDDNAPQILTTICRIEEEHLGRFSVTKPISIRGADFLVVQSYPYETTLKQLLYGLLRQALLSGELQRMTVCDWCDRLTYSKTAPKRFCSEKCGNDFNNARPDRGPEYRKRIRKLRQRKGRVEEKKKR